MAPALLTTILFSLSGVFASRTTRMLGGNLANFVRLCLATLLLALWAHGLGGGMGGGAFGWFFLSGCVGFGIGDVALYQALPRLGARLSILLVHCLAAPVAIAVEWLWLGTVLTALQWVGGGLILLGVGLALAPAERPQIERRVLWVGVVFGVLAAIGQGGGAVLSRKAYETVALAGASMDGGTAAYQRILGGLLVGGVPIAWAALPRIFNFDAGRSAAVRGSFWERLRPAMPWVVLNALAGPTAGVACYQWALQTAPSGVVLPVVAITPLVVIPFSYHFEQDRPGRRAVAGGVLAVAGAVLLAMSRT